MAIKAKTVKPKNEADAAKLASDPNLFGCRVRVTYTPFAGRSGLVTGRHVRPNKPTAYVVKLDRDGAATDPALSELLTLPAEEFVVEERPKPAKPKKATPNTGSLE